MQDIKSSFCSLLSGNQLKLIAAISMTIDHIGLQFFPGIDIFRIIGRLAFPIFAYMIAEGCAYTKNRIKYLLTMLCVALGCQTVYFIALGSLKQCILVTFSLSVITIYALDSFLKRRDLLSGAVALAVIGTVFLISEILPIYLRSPKFSIDYGFFGILAPVLIYLGKNKHQKLCLTALSLVLLAYTSSWKQWFALLSLPLLFLYSGKRGKARMKYFFYIYYPAHLAVIYLLSRIL